MAKILLSDGRHVPLVPPTLRDGIQAEVRLKKAEKISRDEYKEMAKAAQFQTALSIYATLRKAGEDVDFIEVLDLDYNALGAQLVAEPGDESEGEETSDPPSSETPAAGKKKAPRKRA